MDARNAFAGAADGPFERIVHNVVTEGELLPHALSPDALVGALPGYPVLVAVMRRREGDLAEVERLLGATRAAALDIALVGGGPDAAEGLRELLAAHTGARVTAWHVADDGAARLVAGDEGESRLAPLLEPPDAPPNWARFWETAAARTSEAAEMAHFQQRIQGRKPRATWALVAAIVSIYVAGLSWGAPEDIDALMRMGAFYGPAVRDGEVWRLLSSTFLHGSAMHVAFNAYVLWAIGSVVERILGTARFLVLYAAAGLGGGLLSLLLSDSVGVGASGAVWGLMTAELALVWRPTGLLPEPLRARMRQGAVQTLIMNVLISFMPGIGWAAHAGGGLVGAALVFSGALTGGLPRWAGGEEVGADVVPAAVRVGAWISVALLAASLVAAFAVGRPWELGG